MKGLTPGERPGSRRRTCLHKATQLPMPKSNWSTCTEIKLVDESAGLFVEWNNASGGNNASLQTRDQPACHFFVDDARAGTVGPDARYLGPDPRISRLVFR